MKKVKFFSFALAALMLGACSSEDTIDNGGPGTVLPGEKGYVSFAVNLPTTPGSRVNYEDGTPNEYEVYDATLLLFTGADEASSTCQGVYSLDVSAFLESPEDQITSTAQIVREITKPSDEESNIYALVVLNRNNVFDVNTLDNTGTIKGEAIVGKTFDYFYNTAMTLQASDLKGTGFFMANAPLYSKAGGTANPDGGAVTTLSEIDANKICSTEAEALATPATTVYVERALGKVTLTGSTDLSADYNVNIASYVINGWALDNTNNSTYLVRNVASAPWWGYQNAANGYRFVEGTPVKSGVSLFRTHFGVDPNYSADYSAANFTTVGGSTIADDDLLAANGTTPAYCLENTFDVAHMTEQNTTRVIVAATLTVTGAESSGDFYLLNNNTSMIYQKSGVENEVKRLWMNYFESIKSTYIQSGTFTKDDVTVTFSSDANGGYLTVATVTMAEPESGIAWKDGQSLATLNAAAAAYVATINSNLKIAYYKGGVAYYPVLIKHFGITETPWSTSDIVNGNSYPGTDASQKWLGRYGVLRNTWYQLNVTGLRNIGSPNVPEVTDTYDDPGEQYISVEINILPWAVRTQDVEL